MRFIVAVPLAVVLAGCARDPVGPDVSPRSASSGYAPISAIDSIAPPDASDVRRDVDDIRARFLVNADDATTAHQLESRLQRVVDLAARTDSDSVLAAIDSAKSLLEQLNTSPAELDAIRMALAAMQAPYRVGRSHPPITN